MKTKHLTLIAVMSIFTLTLTGCGAGGGGGGEGATPTTTTTTTIPGVGAGTATFLFYTEERPLGGFDGSIWAVDPAVPAPPTQVESGPTTGASQIFHGNYDGATRTVSDLHTRTIVYAKGGSLWKVSALKTDPLTPSQISGETGAGRICDYESTVDLTDHNSAEYVYLLPGVDGVCNFRGGIWKMVKVGMSGTEVPFTARKPVTEIYDLTDGRLSGWLAVEGGNLNRYDENFGYKSTLAPFTIDVEEGGGSFTNIVLVMDGKLHIYDTPAGTLSGPRHTLTSSLVWGQNDSDHFYFADANEIYRLPLDGSENATSLVTESGSGQFSYLGLTDNHVVYVWYDGIDYVLKAIPKAGGTPIPLLTTSDILEVEETSGSWIYYTKLSGSGVPTAGVIKDDGTGPSETLNASWVGWTLPTMWPVDVDPKPSRFIRAEGYNSTTGFAGGTLTSYDAANNTPVATLGTLPPDIEWVGFYGFGGDILGLGGETSVLPSQQDIFFGNVDTPNSLKRVTETPGTNESPLGN